MARCKTRVQRMPNSTRSLHTGNVRPWWVSILERRGRWVHSCVCVTCQNEQYLFGLKFFEVHVLLSW